VESDSQALVMPLWIAVCKSALQILLSDFENCYPGEFLVPLGFTLGQTLKVPKVST
jgi:hypothetical protein